MLLYSHKDIDSGERFLLQREYSLFIMYTVGDQKIVFF